MPAKYVQPLNAFGLLGEARDAEVMHSRLKDMIAEEPGVLVMGPVTRRIDLGLGADYQKAHSKVLKAVDRPRYFRLLDALESVLATPSLAPRVQTGTQRDPPAGQTGRQAPAHGSPGR